MIGECNLSSTFKHKLRRCNWKFQFSSVFNECMECDFTELGFNNGTKISSINKLTKLEMKVFSRIYIQHGTYYSFLTPNMCCLQTTDNVLSKDTLYI